MSERSGAEAQDVEARFSGADLQRTVMGGFFGFTTFLFVQQARHPGQGGVALSVIAWVSALLSAVMMLRGARSATIIASRTRVTYRSLLRTRHWTWSQIDGFEARDSGIGLMQNRRRVLFLRERGGRVWRLAEINDAPSSVFNPIDHAAEQLNRLADGAW